MIGIFEIKEWNQNSLWTWSHAAFKAFPGCSFILEALLTPVRGPEPCKWTQGLNYFHCCQFPPPGILLKACKSWQGCALDLCWLRASRPEWPNVPGSEGPKGRDGWQAAAVPRGFGQYNSSRIAAARGRPAKPPNEPTRRGWGSIPGIREPAVPAMVGKASEWMAPTFSSFTDYLQASRREHSIIHIGSQLNGLCCGWGSS